MSSHKQAAVVSHTSHPSVSRLGEATEAHHKAGIRRDRSGRKGGPIYMKRILRASHNNTILNALCNQYCKFHRAEILGLEFRQQKEGSTCT